MIAKEDIQTWIKLVESTLTQENLLKTLTEFRTYEWTPQEQQRVSHAYIKMLKNIPVAEADSIIVTENTNIQTNKQIPENQDPVWYEKM